MGKGKRWGHRMHTVVEWTVSIVDEHLTWIPGEEWVWEGGEVHGPG